MNIFNLFASLKLDTSDYEKGVETAKKEGEDFADDVNNKVAPTAALGWAAIGAAVVKVVEIIGKLAIASINYADTISDLAAQYGVSTDAISEMQYIAEQSSTSIEGLTSSMTMLYNRAKQDGEAFKNLGISVTDANGNFKSMDELFWETANALNSIDDEGQKSAVMLDLFGRSAMNVGEVLRKSTDEINAMRKEAHELGVVMSEDTVQFASDFNDQMAVLKMQGKSAIASLLSGAPDAEDRLEEFFDNLLSKLENYLPVFVNFGVRLLIQTVIAMVKIAPRMVGELLNAVIDTIFSINWLQVGVDIGKSVLEGVLNIVIAGLNAVLGMFGVKIPAADLGVGDNLFTEESLGGEYEISENVRQEITVNVKASGDNAINQSSAEETAKALAPYIDRILGSK